ncbi:MAG TPA: hypothetical protein PKO19_07365 [Chitinophagales bacterium]|nr:hypothetical protein [Chitinophagales bacterium]
MKKQYFIAIAVTFLLATLGMGLWLAEILFVKGWHGLQWLSGILYTPYFITMIAAIAFILPFAFVNRRSIKQLLIPALLIYFTNLVFYVIGTYLCYAVYYRFLIFNTRYLQNIYFDIIVYFTLFGFFYWLVTDRLIKRIKFINMLLISFAAALSVILSLATVAIIPGFGTGTDLIDAVKMGYNVFWIIFMLGISGWSIAVKKPMAQKLNQDANQIDLV